MPAGVVREKGLGNIIFEQRDLAERPLEGPYDLITAFDAVHDQRDPTGLLRSIHDALAPGGVFVMQDIAGSSQLEKNFDHLVAALLYAVSTTHCACMSLGRPRPGHDVGRGYRRADAPRSWIQRDHARAPAARFTIS